MMTFHVAGRRAGSGTALLGLILALGSPSGSAGSETVISDKTLVAWVSPADLAQRGGSVLTIEKEGGVFDAIVLGEIAASRWMAGSDLFKRTQADQSSSAVETADADTLVQVAVVYEGNHVTVLRNGAEYASYTVEGAERFDEESIVLMGLRHLDANPGAGRFFVGTIDDARIYDRALDSRTIASLKPDEASDPRPLAWWTFEDGKAADRMGSFASTTLVGDARIAGGRLRLEKAGAFLMASRRAPTEGRARPGDVDSSARSLREKLLRDPHRPGYHFVAPEGRCMPFDPNGAIYWKERYHLFYIFQDHRGHNWGHVSSTDLFHWRHHPTGLVSGMFSGNCFVNKDGRPTVCYHQVGQGNAMAVSLDDELNEWKKLETNPITPRTAPGDPHHDAYRSWDPYGWLEGDTYYAIFGGERPAIAKSPSLGGEWRYVGDLMANSVEGVSIHEDVSCADFFKLGDRHMLLCISHRLGCRYYLGDWKDEAFHPTFHERMSWTDNSFFAPESLLDGKGRRIMWAWIFDGPDFKTHMDFGWSGTMSLPRVLWLAEDGTLRMDVPQEIELLRYNRKSEADLAVPADAEVPLAGIQGSSMELCIEANPGGARRFGVKVCRSPGGEEQTLVFYDAAERKVGVDTRRASAKGGPGSVEAGPFELREGEPLKLRVFVDRSVVEAFANQRQGVMRRIYPTREDSLGVALFSEGGEARVTSLEAWDLMPSNPY